MSEPTVDETADQVLSLFDVVAPLPTLDQLAGALLPLFENSDIDIFEVLGDDTDADVIPLSGTAHPSFPYNLPTDDGPEAA